MSKNEPSFTILSDEDSARTLFTAAIDAAIKHNHDEADELLEAGRLVCIQMIKAWTMCDRPEMTRGECVAMAGYITAEAALKEVRAHCEGQQS
jgi:hypothetical protein